MFGSYSHLFVLWKYQGCLIDFQFSNAISMLYIIVVVQDNAKDRGLPIENVAKHRGSLKNPKKTKKFIAVHTKLQGTYSFAFG